MSMTVLDLIRSAAGLDCGALPLSLCKLIHPHLLTRAGIDPDGTGTACLLVVPYVLTPDVDDPTRNVSLYAVPRDYHLYFRKFSDELLPALRAMFPSHTFALFADHAPIAEVDAAARAGLGVIGCNGLLLTRQWGSFVFIGEIITDAPWEVITGLTAEDIPTDPPKKCMVCGKCLRACPGGCDVHKREGCLSALTQKKGTLTPEEIAVLSAHPLVWGCDICQTVCPRNRAVVQRGIDTPIEFFRTDRLSRLDAQVLAAMDDNTFAERAYAWRGRAIIERNIQIKERTDKVT